MERLEKERLQTEQLADLIRLLQRALNVNSARRGASHLIQRGSRLVHIKRFGITPGYKILTVLPDGSVIKYGDRKKRARFNLYTDPVAHWAQAIQCL